MKVFAKVTGIGGAGTENPNEFNIIIKWLLLDTGLENELAFTVDMSEDQAEINHSLRTQVAAYVANASSQTITADDIFDFGVWLSNRYGLTPIVVPMPSLLATDDVCRVTIPTIPGYATIQLDAVPWSISTRALISGTATMNVKNGAGTTVASRAITAAGVFSFTPTTSTIAAGDVLRFGFSGLGLGLSDVCVTAWLKMPSVH